MFKIRHGEIDPLRVFWFKIFYRDYNSVLFWLIFTDTNKLSLKFPFYYPRNTFSTSFDKRKVTDNLGTDRSNDFIFLIFSSPIVQFFIFHLSTLKIYLYEIDNHIKSVVLLIRQKRA